MMNYDERLEKLEKLRDDDHREIMDAILDVRNEVVGGRNEVSALREDFVDLKTYVNHEQTEMVRSMTDFQKDFAEKLDGKLANDQLLTSLIFQLLNNRYIRWAFGLVVGAFGTYVSVDAIVRYFPFIRDAITSFPGL